MERAHHYVHIVNIQNRLRIGKNTYKNYNTNADSFKGNSNKNKMVNNDVMIITERRKIRIIVKK